MSWRVKLGEVTFPVAPARITVGQKSRNRTVNLIDGSQAVIAKGPALQEYRLELLLPRCDYPFAHYENGFRDPEYFLDAVSGYAKEGVAVELSVVRGKKTESCAVYVGDVTVSESAEEGEDVKLTLTLTASGETATSTRIPETYTVREGDTLRLIARRIWGDETLWNYLYGFNVDVIEAAARGAGFADSRFGERLGGGITLVIPQEVSANGKRS